MPRVTLDLSNEVNSELDAIAKANCISKAEVMRRAFALLSIAQEEKGKGRCLGIIEDSGKDGLKAIGKVVGV